MMDEVVMAHYVYVRGRAGKDHDDDGYLMDSELASCAGYWIVC